MLRYEQVFKIFVNFTSERNLRSEIIILKDSRRTLLRLIRIESGLNQD